MAFTEDLTVFFDADDFAVAATIGTSTVYGILDKEYVEVESGRAIVTGYQPTFTASTSSISTVDVGDTITISTVSYVVAAPPQSDGTGITKLILRT